MRMVPQNEFFTSYDQPPTRVHWSAVRAKKGAEQAAQQITVPPEIVTSLDELLQLTKQYFVDRRRWLAAQNETVPPEMAQADNSLDRSFSNFVERVAMELEDHGPDSARGEAAKRMLDGPLNIEVFSVTNAKREEQEAMTESILAELATDHMPDIQTCGLEASFGVVQDNFAEFAARMDDQISGDAAPTTDQLKEQKALIDSKMIEVIHRTNGAFPTTSAHDFKWRSMILGPFAIQNDRAAAFFKRNRGKNTLPDIDPETGEEIVDDTTEPENE